LFKKVRGTNPNHRTCQPIFFILKARRQKLIAMKVCKTAIDKLSEPKLGPKPRNEFIEQTYYQDELAFCWSLDDHEHDLNPDLTYQNLDISHEKHLRDN
jgi:hypothetical protein